MAMSTPSFRYGNSVSASDACLQADQHDKPRMDEAEENAGHQRRQERAAAQSIDYSQGGEQNVDDRDMVKHGDIPSLAKTSKVFHA